MLLSPPVNLHLRCVFYNESCFQDHFQQMVFDASSSSRLCLYCSKGIHSCFASGEDGDDGLPKFTELWCDRGEQIWRVRIQSTMLPARFVGFLPAWASGCVAAWHSVLPDLQASSWSSSSPLSRALLPSQTLFTLLAWNVSLGESRKMFFLFPLLYWKWRAVSDPLTIILQPSQPGLGYILIAFVFFPFQRKRSALPGSSVCAATAFVAPSAE